MPNDVSILEWHRRLYADDRTVVQRFVDCGALPEVDVTVNENEYRVSVWRDEVVVHCLCTDSWRIGLSLDLLVSTCSRHHCNRAED